MAVINRLKYDALSDEWFVWKHPSEELRLGTQLIVHQTQEAVLFKGGKALDLFGPGTHTLATGNIPFLSKLVNLPYGGKTPFTAEVWYVNKHAKRDLRWGTRSPIPLIDPVYNYPVSVRAHGRWGIRIEDARLFLDQLVGTLSECIAEKIEEYFVGELLQRLGDALSKYLVEQHLSVFHVNARLNELSEGTAIALTPEFARFGLEVVNFNVERISIPDEEQKKFQDVLGKRMEIDQLRQAQVGPAYTTKRTFDTLDKAAEAEGSGNLLSQGLGLGIGLGAGTSAGRDLGGALSPSGKESEQQEDVASKLRQLKQLMDEGLISQEDYETKKKQLLGLL